jgi:hypothetical protein
MCGIRMIQDKVTVVGRITEGERSACSCKRILDLDQRYGGCTIAVAMVTACISIRTLCKRTTMTARNGNGLRKAGRVATCITYGPCPAVNARTIYLVIWCCYY